MQEGEVIIRQYLPGDEKGIVRLLDLVFNGWPSFDLECSKIDHWYWLRKIIGEKTVSLTINLQNLADKNYTGSIKVRMMGETDIPATNGHLVAVSVNDEYIGETSWYGITEHDFTGLIEQNFLKNGDNKVEISLNPGKSNPDNPLDPVKLDGINLNWIEFQVEKNLTAENGSLIFRPL